MTDIGKIPPQSLQAECDLLGMCLIDTDMALEICETIRPEMFYKQSHQIIFDAIITVLRTSGVCDIALLSDVLMKSGKIEQAGGMLYITQLTMPVVSTASAPQLAMLVKEKYLLREYIRLGNEIIKVSFDGDLDEVVNKAESELLNLSSVNIKRDFVHISKSIDEQLVIIGKIHRNELDVVGVPSGFTEIDRYTSGWQRSELIIIAGRPSMGKTAMALELARKTAELGRGVAFFSLEMGNQQLATRYLSSETGLSNTQLRTGRVGNYEELVQRANNIATLPIYVDDTSAISLFQLRSKLRRLKAKQPIDLVFIDYLQLMKAEAKSREQEVSQVSRGLKEIAKEMQIPIIALSQLNREVETRGNRWPRLSDLRESGAIEQDADMVIFLYRPAYYREETIQFDGKQLNTDGLLLFDIAKHRNGALGTIPLKHNASITRIVSNDEQFDITPF